MLDYSVLLGPRPILVVDVFGGNCFYYDPGMKKGRPEDLPDKQRCATLLSSHCHHHMAPMKAHADGRLRMLPWQDLETGT